MKPCLHTFPAPLSSSSLSSTPRTLISVTTMMMAPTYVMHPDQCCHNNGSCTPHSDLCLHNNGDGSCKGSESDGGWGSKHACCWCSVGCGLSVSAPSLLSQRNLVSHSAPSLLSQRNLVSHSALLGCDSNRSTLYPSILSCSCHVAMASDGARASDIIGWGLAVVDPENFKGVQAEIKSVQSCTNCPECLSSLVQKHTCLAISCYLG